MFDEKPFIPFVDIRRSFFFDKPITKFFSFINFQGCNNTVRAVSLCLQTEFQCNDRITCIHKSWLCDGGMDCPNGDDEKPPHCQNVTCRPDQFQCKDRTCIPGHLMCSGKAECKDGSDELNCSELLKCKKKIIFANRWESKIFMNFVVQHLKCVNVMQRQSSTAVVACAYLIQRCAIRK